MMIKRFNEMLSSKEKTLINVRQITSNGSLKDIRRKCECQNCVITLESVKTLKLPLGINCCELTANGEIRKHFFPTKSPKQQQHTQTHTNTHIPSWYNYQSTQISKLKSLYMNGQTNFFKRPKYCSNKGSSCII